MAIELNEQIRDEARKMSEYVVEDTKRTVEMLQWLKAKQPASALAEAVKAGSALATGSIGEGAKSIVDAILPRLRDRLQTDKPDPLPANPIDKSIEQITAAKDKIIRLRNIISSNEISVNAFNDICAVDDLCFDAIIHLFDALDSLGGNK